MIRAITQTNTVVSVVSSATKGTITVTPTSTVYPQNSTATVYDPVFLPPDPSCPTVTATISGNPFVSNYTRYYSGCGRTEAFGNPGDRAPQNLQIVPNAVGDSNSCKVIRQCAQLARNSQGGGSLSFDVHYRYSSGKWECRLWSGPNTDATWFSEVDTDVRDVYGYSYFDSTGVEG